MSCLHAARLWSVRGSRWILPRFVAINPNGHFSQAGLLRMKSFLCALKCQACVNKAVKRSVTKVELQSSRERDAKCDEKENWLKCLQWNKISGPELRFVVLHFLCLSRRFLVFLRCEGWTRFWSVDLFPFAKKIWLNSNKIMSYRFGSVTISPKLLFICAQHGCFWMVGDIIQSARAAFAGG